MVKRQHERGQAIIWTAVILPFFLSLIGLAADEGLVLDQYQALQLLANGAARTAAEQVDTQVYYQSGGTVVVLNQPAARQAALQYVQRQATGIDGVAVTAGPQSVTVTVERTAPLAFLRIVHLDSVRLQAASTAQLASAGAP